MKSSIPWIRRCKRLFRMVGELHRMGLQHLRIMPYEHPLAYRFYVGPSTTFSPSNGAFMPGDFVEPYACHSSASGNRYFEWNDAHDDDARALAEKFVARFPDLVSASTGSDWAYAGWLADLIHVLDEYPDRLPIVMAEYMEPGPERLQALPLRLYGERVALDPGGEMTFPLPPPPLQGAN